MILDLPPNVEQDLIQTAQQKGVTVEQLLLDMITKQSNEMMLNTENTHFFTVNDEQYQFLLSLLDDDTPANDELKALLGGV